VVSRVSGRGLWAGVSFSSLSGRAVCELLMAGGVLAKETHGNTIRLAPPLIITESELDWALDRIEAAVSLPGLLDAGGRAARGARGRAGRGARGAGRGARKDCGRRS